MYTDTASPGPKRCASWRLTMVQNFQTLPEIGRAGLKVGTIQKSTKSVQKHGPANKREAGDPCWCHPKSWGPSAVLCIPQARELCHSAPGNSGGNSQEAPGNSETCFRQFGCSVHAQNVGISVIRPAIRVAIREQFTAIRDVFRQFGCSAHAQNVGNSAIRSPHSSPFKKGKRTEYPWMHCARSNNSRILPYKTLETGGDGVLEFYHGHCGSAMEAAEFFLAETRVCGIPCHWRIHCALPAKK